MGKYRFPREHLNVLREYMENPLFETSNFAKIGAEGNIFARSPEISNFQKPSEDSL
jgi:hypothetical protein